MIYALAIDNSIAFTKDKYYFRYKDHNFKYIPHHQNGETDDLLCEIPNDSSQPFIYELITEFLSAFAIANEAKVLIHSGLIIGSEIRLIESKNRYVKKRSIHAVERMNEFYHLILLKTPDQIQLARLYREAFSCDNLYMKILFYWHCLVYPDTGDDKAVEFIDTVAKDLPGRVVDAKDDLNFIVANKVFATRKDEGFDESIGKYIKESIRHSIAHIVRRPEYGVSLKMDSWEQIRHLSAIESFMHAAAKYRLEEYFDMKPAWDPAIFRCVAEKELIVKEGHWGNRKTAFRR